MRVLGLDLGTKTLGLAISDKTNTIANPLPVIRYQNSEMLIAEIKKIIAAKEITTIVLGLPKNMNNSSGFAAQRSLDFKELLAKNIEIEIVLIDERLSTIEAENILITNDVSRKKRKNKIDGLAACIILDTYLRMKGD